ncbi:MAG TPA: aldo/keto reductase [Candidatus Lokiarchaeia archaeon]|nr:aldo/keto reductase [Candidatus Lokiarchaeia archaeon]
MDYMDFKGEKISRLCLGTVQLGKEYGIANKTGKPSRDIAFSILRRATDGGINIFDTAVNYGESEKIIGKFIHKQRKTEKPFIITKIPQIPDTVKENGVHDYVLGQVMGSLKRINLTKIPFCLLHGPADVLNYGDEIIKVFKELKASKKILHYGVSIYTVEDVRNFLNHEEFDTIQIPFNIFDQKLQRNGLIQELHESNVCIMVRSVFLQGLFFLQPDEAEQKVAGSKEPLDVLRTMVEEEDISIDALALGFVKSIPEVVTILVGAEKQEQIARNLAIFDATNLPVSTIDRISQAFQDIPGNVTNPSKWNVG